MTTICFGASLICGVCCLLLQTPLPALSWLEVGVVVLLGIGPAGGAFYLWDLGIRHGNAAVLGVLGYSAPVLSTVLMYALGLGETDWEVAGAVTLITLGGVVVQTGMRRAESPHTE